MPAKDFEGLTGPEYEVDIERARLSGTGTISLAGISIMTLVDCPSMAISPLDLIISCFRE